MVKIRLKRIGRRNRPCFRVVVTDIRNKRDGEVLETVGHYDPLKSEGNMTLKKERVDYWLSVGAQPSDGMRPLLKKEGVAV